MEKDLIQNMLNSNVDKVLHMFDSSNMKRYYVSYRFCAETFKRLYKIMDQFIDSESYAIGGSVAAMLYGIDIKRLPHDIDIIVPVGMLDTIKKKVRDSIFFMPCSQGTSSTDQEFMTNHFAFETVRGLSIDIIEAADFNDKDAKYKITKDCAWYDINVMSPQHLYNAKKMYHRSKDFEDLKALEELLISIQAWDYNIPTTDLDEEFIKLSAVDKRTLFTNNIF